MPTTLILMGGGPSSAAALCRHKEIAKASGRERLECVRVSLGGKSDRHINQTAAALTDHYGVPFTLIDLPDAYRKTPVGVPGVGCDLMISAAVASAHADLIGACQLVLPCRGEVTPLELVGHLARTVHSATDGRVHVSAPFLDATLADVLRFGNNRRVPFHLTRSCQGVATAPCGKCFGCTERLDAYRSLKMPDPLEYGLVAIGGRQIDPRKNGDETDRKASSWVGEIAPESAKAPRSDQAIG